MEAGVTPPAGSRDSRALLVRFPRGEHTSAWGADIGKPFASELDLLPATYSWALECSIDGLSAWVEAQSDLPLIAVGSGGSLSSATYVAMLHESATGRPSRYVTPLELGLITSAQSTALVLLTAGGSNPDIIAATLETGALDSPSTMVMVLKRQSTIGRTRAKYPWIDLVEFDSPAGKDGFLATNSLLATMALAHRAYTSVFPGLGSLPATLVSAEPTLRGDSGAGVGPALARSTYLVLYEGWGKPAALDLESKLSESGLAAGLVSDFRNFAHGRHYWLANHPSTTAIVALVSSESKRLWENTAKLIPPEIPIIELATSAAGPQASIPLVSGVMTLVNELGKSQGVDPGKPTVPDFGRRIYHMSSRAAQKRKHVMLDQFVQRKLGAPMARWPSSVTEATASALRETVARLEAQTFGGILFDYDGTLCPTEHRFGDLPSDIADALNSILLNGVPVGIATGRGKSVYSSLRRSIDDAYWSRVLVGYYNGGIIKRLDSPPPSGDGTPQGQLKEFVDDASRHSQLIAMAEPEIRIYQASLQPRTGISTDRLFAAVAEFVSRQNYHDLAVVRSGHSVDVLSAGVSKLLVRSEMAATYGLDLQRSPILSIGDSGSLGGNDSALLASPWSLSVDQAPSLTDSAWNLAPPGHRGVAATLDYLAAMNIEEDSFSLDLGLLTGDLS